MFNAGRRFLYGGCVDPGTNVVGKNSKREDASGKRAPYYLSLFSGIMEANMAMRSVASEYGSNMEKSGWTTDESHKVQ